MINGEDLEIKLPTGVAKYWIGFALSTILGDTFHMAAAGRKFINNHQFTIPGSIWENQFNINIRDFGYKEHSTKMKQLTRIYYNSEEIEQAKVKLQERINRGLNFSSVAVSMRAGKKNEASQGHCIQTLVVNYQPRINKTDIVVFYRITEVLKKFGADLVFLHDIVIPNILLPGMKINSVTLNFNVAYFCPQFTPVLYKYYSPISILHYVKAFAKKNNEKPLLNSVARVIALPLTKHSADNCNYQAQKNMFKLAEYFVENNKYDFKEIEQYMREQDIWNPKWDL